MLKNNPKAFPFADRELTVQILELIEIGKTHNQLKKGANETSKIINKGYADLVVIAVDSDPIEIVLHLPLLCEDKNIPYVFIDNKKALGKACGLSRSVVACGIPRGIDPILNEQIKNIRNKIERFLN